MEWCVPLFWYLLLIPLCGIGPGFLIARRWRGIGGGERLVISIGLSLLMIYLATFGLFAAHVDAKWNWLISAGCSVVTIIQIRPIWRMVRVPSVRRMLLAWAFVFASMMLFIMPLRHLSGGGWVIDWLEHYERSRYFLGQLPDAYRFIKTYPLPARPPMMNILTAFGMSQTVVSFESFQTVSALLNSLIFLPLCLWGRWFCRRLKVGLLGCAMIAAPVFVAHCLFPWTKLLCGFYLLLSLYCYVIGIGRRREKGVRILVAFGGLGAAMVVHYSAGPYAALLGCHYLWRIWRERGMAGRSSWLKRLALATVAPGLIIAIWAGWSTLRFGAVETFGSNTTVVDARELTIGGNVLKIGRNIIHSIVPHPLIVPRDYFENGQSGFEDGLSQNSALGWWRDYVFQIYQTNVIAMMGSVGGLLVIGLLVRQVYWKRQTPAGPGAAQRRFWQWFIPGIVVLGIAVHGRFASWGLGHICLAPMALLGVAYLMANLQRLGRMARFVLVLGMSLDAVMGILIHLIAQSRVFKIMPTADGNGVWVRTAESLSRPAVLQYRLKLRNGLTMFGDHFPDHIDALLIACFVLLFVAVLVVAREMWIGYAGRNAHGRNRQDS